MSNLRHQHRNCHQNGQGWRCLHRGFRESLQWSGLQGGRYYGSNRLIVLNIFQKSTHIKGDGNMAQINLSNIKKIEKQRNVIHDKVYTTYTVFEMDGSKYIQIDTYGKIDRENPEKVSQSIQLDQETAKYLVNLLTQEFNLM